jgi:hypothetical protein
MPVLGWVDFRSNRDIDPFGEVLFGVLWKIITGGGVK